jgi:TPR repeat protein
MYLQGQIQGRLDPVVEEGAEEGAGEGGNGGAEEGGGGGAAAGVGDAEAVAAVQKQEALRWLRRASELGHAQAQHQYGLELYKQAAAKEGKGGEGEGTAEGEQEAEDEAAGEARARVQAAKEEAVRWIRKSALQGHPPAVKMFED